MKRITIIAHFMGDFNNSDNNRFNYLANILSAQDFEVEVITSDFFHTLKTYRTKKNFSKFKITLLHEPRYETNISIKRIFSHLVFAKNLKKYLFNNYKTDLIICAFPTPNVCLIAEEYCKKANIKFLLDVQDLWPEAFQMVSNSLLLRPFIHLLQRQSKKIYQNSDIIITVSETFSNIIKNKYKVKKEIRNIFLGGLINTNINKYNKTDTLNLVYIGTIGNSYDLLTVLKAMKKLQEHNSKTKLTIIGNGPNEFSLKSFVRENNLHNVTFLNRIPYDALQKVLRNYDIGLNPIKTNSAASIINKACDYACSGLPVINTQESIEYRNLLTKYNAGVSIENGDYHELFSIIKKYEYNSELLVTQKENSLKMAREMFDREHTYKEYIELIKGEI